MKLSEFLLHHTKAGELCVVCFGGWITATFFIDHEDLFDRYLAKDLGDKPVQKDHWDTLDIVDAQGKPVTIPCHYIEVGD